MKDIWKIILEFKVAKLGKQGKYILNKTLVFVKQECPQQKQSPKLVMFSIKATVKVIDLGVN